MKVVIIGAGNVATVLGKKISLAGNEIVQIVARSRVKAAGLASFFSCDFVDNLLEINHSADIYLISIADSAIGEIASELTLNDKIVVHTAASISKNVLANCSTNYGVLYPLQTLKKELATIPQIPILLDASNDQTKQMLINFTSTWADSVTFTNDENRLKMHIAAVFANNFTNHLFTISKQICYSNGLDFNMLHPLIKETIERVKVSAPEDVQTGPAVRNDWVTITKHQQMLKDDSDALQVYNVLTNSIVEMYNNNKS